MYVCTYLLKHRFALESIYIEIFLDSSQTVCFQLQLGTRVCFYSARTVHAQCTATVHGLETLQIPQKMAPRLQNIEKTGCRIFFWFHAISTDDVLFTPFPARALRRALCVHCQNTRTRPAPPSCSEPWCCAVLAAAVCLLVSLCARSWNTIVSLKGPCSISRYLQIFWEYCWWKKSCTAAGMFDNTVWLLPPHPLFNVVFSSLARRCRISVIQLLCFCDNFFLPMLNGEHEGQDSKCVWWCRIFSINRMIIL